MNKADPQPVIDALRAQRNAALDSAAELHAMVLTLQKRVAELEQQPASDPPTAA